MPAYLGYFRVPWLFWLVVPACVWGLGYMAWEVSAPGFVVDLSGGRRHAWLRALIEQVPAPVLAALLAAFAAILLVVFVMLVCAVAARKPAFRLDGRGVTRFSLLGGKPHFIAWRDVQRLQESHKLVLVTGGRKDDGRPYQVSLDVQRKKDHAALATAVSRYRSDLLR